MVGSCKSVCAWVMLVVLAWAAWAKAAGLGIRADQLTLDGKPTFMLGCSYYGALGASQQTIRSDLDTLHHLGFNWVRVFADWTPYDANLSAFDVANGKPRPPYLHALVWLVGEADRVGMAVDVTLARGADDGRPCLKTLPAYRRAVETVVTALKDRGNWYMDLSNEHNVGDQRFTSIKELADLAELAHRLDPRLLVTASNAGDASRRQVEQYLKSVKLDFISIHRPREAGTATNTAGMTRQYRKWMHELGRVVPIMYDEPFRRGYGAWQPRVSDFRADLAAARSSGAAGWCFHNGDTRAATGRKPRRSFDLRHATLFQQLDPVERQFVHSTQSSVLSPQH